MTENKEEFTLTIRGAILEIDEYNRIIFEAQDDEYLTKAKHTLRTRIQQNLLYEGAIPYIPFKTRNSIFIIKLGELNPSSKDITEDQVEITITGKTWVFIDTYNELIKCGISLTANRINSV